MFDLLNPNDLIRQMAQDVNPPGRTILETLKLAVLALENHDAEWCPIYNDVVLPDPEDDHKCSLCGLEVTR